MLSPIFWRTVQGQKHPGRWEIVEQQIPSIKVLFKINAKNHSQASWYQTIIIREQDTIGKPKKIKSGIQPRNFALARNTVLHNVELIASVFFVIFGIVIYFVSHVSREILFNYERVGGIKQYSAC